MTNKVKYYDFVICHIGPTMTRHKEWLREISSLKLNFVIISVNTIEDRNKIPQSNFKEDFINLKPSIQLEKQAMEYAYDNYFSSNYFLVGNNDIADDFKLIFLRLRHEKDDLIIVKERINGYYSNNYKKNIINTSMSPGSQYAYFSRRFLKLFLKNEDGSSKNYGNDLIWEAIYLYEKNKDKINGLNGNYFGANSQVPQYKIDNMRSNILLKKFFIFPIFILMPFFVYIMFDFSISGIFMLLGTYIILNIGFYLIYLLKFERRSLLCFAKQKISSSQKEKQLED